MYHSMFKACGQKVEREREREREREIERERQREREREMRSFCRTGLHDDYH